MIQKARGTLDILPKDINKWHFVEEIIREICKIYGFSEMRVPTFEATDLFARGMGDTTDVVQKEMYSFEIKGESLTLRPEGTAGIMRAVIENSLYGEALPLKLYYIMNCFRYEKPQAGRYREYSTFGIEELGATSPISDGEIIALANMLFERLNIKAELNINSIGCANENCRANYNKALKEYLSANYNDLCETCKSRFERNPMRILDCKSDVCKKIVENAPKSKDYLCEECQEHFDKLQEYLNAMNIKFKINPLIVRGLDYYTKTVFEFISDNIGAQGTICGGGRYDGLSELIGGPKLPGIGFGIGINRLVAALENSNNYCDKSNNVKIYIAAFNNNKAKEWAVKLANELRINNIYAETDNMERSLKAQMKYADKIGAEFVYIIGESEVENGKAVLKNMKTSEQKECRFDELVGLMK